MSAYSDILAGAAKAAQNVLASMADPTNDGAFTFGGTSYTGVLNLRVIAMEPGPNGLQRIEELTIAATTVQFASAPAAAPRVAVTALGRSWYCTRVEPAGALYLLTCVPA